MATQVINLKNQRCNVYIGRTKTKFHWGNPFIIGPDGNRDEVCDKFEKWFDGSEYQHIEPERRKWMIEKISTLYNKTLGCFCEPERCHGLYLALKAEESYKQKGGEDYPF